MRGGTRFGAAIGAIALLLRAGSARGQEAEAKPPARAEPAPAPEPNAPAARSAGENAETRASDEGEENEGRLPLSYTERPLTLPRFILNPLAEFNVSKEDATFVNLGLGAAFGVTDDFEIEANVAPLQLSPSFTYGQGEQPGPSLGVTYRYYAGGTEAALHLDATMFTLPGTSGVIVRPGIPFRGHAGKRVRIDFGVFVPVTASHTTAVGLQLPFAIAVDIAEPVHLGVSSGIMVESVTGPSGIDIPFGVFGGYAIGGKGGPIVDIDPFVRWPKAATSDNRAYGSSTLDVFQVGVEIGGFLYL